MLSCCSVGFDYVALESTTLSGSNRFWLGLRVTLLCKATESPDNEAIDGGLEGFAGEGERADEAEGVSGLFQALLGQAAKLPQPRCDE